MYYVFRDYKSNLEFIRSGQQLHNEGIFVALHAFEYCIFLDFVEVQDATGEYGRLAGYLNGRGTSNMQSALREMKLLPLMNAVGALISKDVIGALRKSSLGREGTPEERIGLERISDDAYAAALTEAALFVAVPFDAADSRARVAEFRHSLRSVADLVAKKSKGTTSAVAHPMKRSFVFGEKDTVATAFTVSLCVLLIDEWTKIAAMQKEPARLESPWVIFDAERVFTQVLEKKTKKKEEAEYDVLMVKILSRFVSRFWHEKTASILTVQEMFEDYALADFLLVHQYADKWYFNKERFEAFLDWMFSMTMIRLMRSETLTATVMDTCFTQILAAKELAAKAEYHVEKLKEYSDATIL